ncbi:MAG: hypothetical protein IPN57_09760 [Ignavibacteria bacterium]|nr:hypothetical protein [Ignavibacteria bacterium]
MTFKDKTNKKNKLHEDLTIENMIHVIAKTYGQCKFEVEEKYTELDFWELMYFEMLNNAD